MSVIQQLRREIEELENERDQIYSRFAEIETALKRKNLLLTAYAAVSSDPELYAKWLISVSETPAPAVAPVAPVAPIIAEPAQ